MNNTLKEGKTLKLRDNLEIYHNQFGEFCVCHSNFGAGSMVSYNAGFKTLHKAKKMAKMITGKTKEQIEKLCEILKIELNYKNI